MRRAVEKVLQPTSGMSVSSFRGMDTGHRTIVRADRQVRDLQALDAVDIETLVEDTVLHNLIAILGSHTTGTKRVPSGFCVPLSSESVISLKTKTGGNSAENTCTHFSICSISCLAGPN
jgi:hypothetical protein